jgi:hypothetical protein
MVTFTDAHRVRVEIRENEPLYLITGRAGRNFTEVALILTVLVTKEMINCSQFLSIIMEIPFS